jgi:hypothetical protein
MAIVKQVVSQLIRQEIRGLSCWCSSSFQPFDIGVGEERAHLGDGDLIQLEQTF